MSVKTAYEALNGTLRDGIHLYQSVNIDEAYIIEMPIREALNIYQKAERSLIYFGAAWCPWYRQIIMPLIKYAKAHDLKIVYVNLDQRRPTYEYENGQFINTYPGDEDYPLLVEAFKDVMEPYEIRIDDQILKVPDSHHIDLPLIVQGSYGTIIDHHYGSVPLKENQTAYDLLDEDQEKSFFELLDQHLTSIGKTCSLNGECL